MQTAKGMAIHLSVSFGQNFSQAQAVPWQRLVSPCGWCQAGAAFTGAHTWRLLSSPLIYNRSITGGKLTPVMAVSFCLQVLQCDHPADVGGWGRQAGHLAGRPHGLHQLHLHSGGSLARWEDGPPEADTGQLSRWVPREWDVPSSW